MSQNKGMVKELMHFLWARKVWWLAPVIVMLILVGVLIIFGASSPLSPFIYALF